MSCYLKLQNSLLGEFRHMGMGGGGVGVGLGALKLKYNAMI